MIITREYYEVDRLPLLQQHKKLLDLWPRALKTSIVALAPMLKWCMLLGMLWRPFSRDLRPTFSIFHGNDGYASVQWGKSPSLPCSIEWNSSFQNVFTILGNLRFTVFHDKSSSPDAEKRWQISLCVTGFFYSHYFKPFFGFIASKVCILFWQFCSFAASLAQKFKRQ